MIARLRGAVAEIGEEDAVLDVMGVGYLVRCGARTLSRLPPPGGEVVLHIEYQWAEATGPRLYGFLDRSERRAFVLLLAIQGVGPKAALGVLDILSPAELAAAAARDDKAAVGRAQGVGPKLAQRIVTELKGKTLAEGVFAGHPLPPAAASPAASPMGEAVAALMGLGVTEVNARRVIETAALELGEAAGLEALIKAGLKELGR